MILDCDPYRINIRDIKILTEKKSQAQRVEMVGKLAVITGVHIIIVCHYIGELYGFTDELNNAIDKLKKFYTIKDVINVRRTI